MASGFSSKTGRGRIGAASFIGAPPLSYGRGAGGEGSWPATPPADGLRPPPVPLGEKGQDPGLKPAVLSKGDPAGFAAALQPADDTLA